MKFLLLSLSLFVGVTLAEAANLNLVYTMNLNGEIEPCGCAKASDQGGLLRRATWLDQKRQQAELITLSFGGLFAPLNQRDQIKDNSILKGISALDYQAIGIQESDLVHGIDFLNQSPVPLVVFNLSGQKITPYQLIENGKHKLFFTQWMGDWVSGSETQLLTERFRLEKANGHTTLLATTLNSDQIAELPLDVIDLLVIQPIDEQIRAPYLHKTTLILQPGTRGQQMGWLQLSLSSKGRVKTWEHQAEPLVSDYVDAPRLANWYQDYNDALKQDYQQRVAFRKKMMSGESAYLGAQACESCHIEEHRLWQLTKHANAWQHLVQKNKTFDPDCLSCHTLGFDQPDGFLDVQMTPGFTGVQCENCHGVGREHVESQGQSKMIVSAEVCDSCHVEDHSPEYNTAEYWQRIAH